MFDKNTRGFGKGRINCFKSNQILQFFKFLLIFTPINTKILLEVSNLTFSIGEKSIIRKFDFRLNEGEIVALLGESGVGKSTILSLLAGLEEPTIGSIYLDNKEVIPPSRKLIAGQQNIKLVKQDYGLFPNITVRENIAYELRLYNTDYRNERVEYLLKLCELTSIDDRLPRNTSGGEQQRTVIARAIADEPRLLLLDEPFSHLDRRNKERLKEEIIEIIDSEKMGCLFVTHEVSDAYGVASRIVVLQNGEVVQDCSPEELYNKPLTAYVATLTGMASFIPQSEFTTWEVCSQAKQVMFRPEWAELADSGVGVITTSCLFQGAFYLVGVQVGELSVFLQSENPIEVGTKCFVQLKKYWELS